MSNSNNNDSAFIAILFCAIVLSFVSGAMVVSKNFQKEAIKLGHATWVADANGNSKFQWNEIKQINY